ncbi:MAG: hypothetical protein EOP22_17025 [Hyphomicrobiales bacterium]|nr:MAG: hypothetical protein EOP22_17025 [Hyphomicrobiales bacterium]
MLSADVGGNVSADAGTGTVRVTLNTGASVGGVIAANEAANSALRFAMTVNSRAEYKAAKAYLGDNANALSGSLTINGQTFTWSGFDQLVQTLVLAGVRSSTSSDTGAPLYLACTPRVVTAFYADGAIALVARRTGERGAFRIGQIMNGAFDSQNTFGWRAALTTAKGQAAFDVLDGTGAKVAACRG